MRAEVIGRDVELRELDQAFEQASPGLHEVLLVGEAGIGKTTLWLEGVDRAVRRGVPVLQCRSSAAEVSLSYTALGDLLAPVPPAAFDALAAPQRAAIDVALLRTQGDGTPIERRVLGTAVASLVTAVAGGNQVLIAVDDAQWLDLATARVLEFAVRRLVAQPVLVLSSWRTTDRDPRAPGLAAGLSSCQRSIDIGPLSPPALGAVLNDRHGQPISRPRLARIHRLSRGNPLHAQELARSIVTAPAAFDELDMPVPDDLRSLVASRIANLPGPTREALLVAALLMRPTTSIASDAALEPAVEAGLIRIHGRDVSFVHPLYASVISTMATRSERLAVHAMLAASSDDVEERARHLAFSVTDPDGRVAAELDLAAARADERGAFEAAGDLAERAAELTPDHDPTAACVRRTLAARSLFRAGDLARARSLIDRATPDAPAGRARGEALQLLARLLYSDNDFAQALEVLSRAIDEDTHPRYLTSIMLDRAYTLYGLADIEAALVSAREALVLAEQADDPGLLAEALAIVGAGEGYLVPGAGLDKLERAVTLEDRGRYLPVQLRPSALLAECLFHNGESARALQLLLELRAWLTDRGAEAELPFVLLFQAMIEWSRGDIAAIIEVASEGAAVARQAGSEVLEGCLLVHRARAYAAAGNTADSTADMAHAARVLASTGWSLASLSLFGVQGFLQVSTGDVEGAAATLMPVIEAFEGGGLPWIPFATCLTDAVEALVGVGQVDRADRLLSGCEGWPDGGQLYCASMLLRARGLVDAARGDVKSALSAVEQAVALDPSGRQPIDTARVLLVRGRLERRLRRSAAARESFDRALALFEQVGAPLWLAQAAAERDRLLSSSTGALTATEMEVAELAAAGLTSQEIALRLFVSRRTVESHLQRVYGKLGIASRAQLSVALAGSSDRP